jgi:ribosomal-protein-alanine N-acetyltransferase
MEFSHNNLLFVLREATINDAQAMTDLEQRVNPQGWSHADFISSISSSHVCQVLASNPCLENKDFDNEGLVNKCIDAYVITSTAADEAELLNIVVSPDYQRQGLATRLLERVCDSFNATIHTLFLEVRASNKAALFLYDNLGFNEVGVRPNYYPSLLSPKKQTASFSHQKSGSKNLREDAIIMAKSL